MQLFAVKMSEYSWEMRADKEQQRHLDDLLTENGQVFKIPTGLPPRRGHGHRITWCKIFFLILECMMKTSSKRFLELTMVIMSSRWYPLGCQMHHSRYILLWTSFLTSIKVTSSLYSLMIYWSIVLHALIIYSIWKHFFKYCKRISFMSNDKKCSFAQTQVQHLGHLIYAKGVQMDTYKIAALLEWPIPNIVEKLRGFLGIVGYYWRSIQNFGRIAGSLLKSYAFRWTSTTSVAFEKLKKTLTHAPGLALPDFMKSFTTESNALGNGIGAVLMQDNRPYISKQLHGRHLLSTYVEEMMTLILKCSKSGGIICLGSILWLKLTMQALSICGSKEF